MNIRVIMALCFMPFLLNSQYSDLSLKNSTLTIGIYGRADCGIVTDKTRDITDDNEIAEAVMDKTGISELGTGFIYEHQQHKYIISCEHVLYKAEKIVGFDSEYNEYELELVGSDMPYDIVVLRFKHKADEQNFEGLKLNDKHRHQSDPDVRHIGFWKIDGSENLKKGSILNRKSYDYDKLPLTAMGYFESSAYIPGGYSGGPVLNNQNQIVGMNTARNTDGSSYALNSRILKRLIHDIIDHGKVMRIFSGIEFAQSEHSEGVIIQSIINNSPASAMSEALMHNKVVNINGQSINSIYDLLLILEELKPHKIMSLGLVSGENIKIKVDELNHENLSKITTHTFLKHSYAQLRDTEEINDLIVVLEQGQKYIIRTAGIAGNKVYCLSDLSQLGIIIRMCALYGYIELGKDEAHIYIKEIKFSKDKSKRVLYY